MEIWDNVLSGDKQSWAIKTRSGKKERLKFRAWVKELEMVSKIINFFLRVGRGSVVIFDVSSNDELHALLTEWTNIVPAGFDIYPLASPYRIGTASEIRNGKS